MTNDQNKEIQDVIQDQIQDELRQHEEDTVQVEKADHLSKMENPTAISNNAQTGSVLTVHYAGFWMRFWAYLLDTLLLVGINGIIIKPVFRAMDISLSDTGFITAYGLITGLVFYLYFILMTKICSQTLGKMVFGLKVIPLNGEKLSWGTVIFREGIGRYISATFNFLYAVVAFTPKKQGLHDLFAETSVIHEQSKIMKVAYAS